MSRTKRKHHGHGIYSRVNSRQGVRYFWIRYKAPDGRRVWERAGTTEQDARDLMILRRSEIAKGTWRHPDDPDPNATTFGDLVTRFLDEYAADRASNYYRNVLEGAHPDTNPRPIVRFFADFLLTDLERDRDVFDRYRRARKARISDSTVRKELTVLHTMFEQAWRWGLVESNPLKRVEKPKAPSPKPNPFTVEEWSKLITATEARWPWLRRVLEMTLVTGSRLKETCSLRWDHVREKELFMPTGKVDNPKAVPIGPTAERVLEDASGGTHRRFLRGFVLLDDDDEPLESQSQRNRVSQRTKDVLRDVGLEDHKFKDIRATAGQWIVESDPLLTEAHAGLFLGHKDRGTTVSYVTLNAGRLRPMLDAIEARLAGAVAAQEQTQ